MLPLLQKALGYFSLSIPGCPIRGHVGAVPSPRRAAHHVMMRLLRLAASPPAGSAPTKSCCSSWLACICMPGSGSLSLLLVRVVIEAAKHYCKPSNHPLLHGLPPPAACPGRWLDDVPAWRPRPTTSRPAPATAMHAAARLRALPRPVVVSPSSSLALTA